MTGLLAALREGSFRCFGPAQVDDPIEAISFDGIEIPKRRSKTIEDPAPEEQFVPVPLIDQDDPLLFRFFIDGSERSITAGFVVDNSNKKRYLPLVIAQIGVATSELHDSRLCINHYDEKTILFFPDSFAKQDLRNAENATRDAARRLKLPITLGFDLYKVDDNDKRTPMDSARASVLARMHEMEVKRIVFLADNENLSRESLLLVDGSIEFFQGMRSHLEAFRNVVGVAKSFDLFKTIGKGKNAESVGNLISRVPPNCRTPANGTELGTLTVASWYLRLHDRRRMTSLDYQDGVVKIEVFAENQSASSALVASARCTRISEHVLALKAPATPSSDRRWASHLYPVHLTERYIKTQFRSRQSIIACL